MDQSGNDKLLSRITMDDILEQAKRSSNHSSPGNDGLGYQFIFLLFNITDLHPLITEVFNQALSEGQSPTSWKDIRVRVFTS